MTRFSTGVTLVMLAIFTAMVVTALGFPRNARFMPLVVGIPAIGLCLLQLLLDLRAARRARAPRRPIPQEGEESDFGPGTRGAEVRSWLWLLGFLGGVLLFGFLLAAPLLIASYLRREAGVRWGRALLAAGVAAGLLHLLFQEALGFRLFEGFLGREIWDALGL